MRNIMAASALSPDRRQAPRTGGLYARDFYSWSMQQAEALSAATSTPSICRI